MADDCRTAAWADGHRVSGASRLVELLRSADRVARRLKVNRSALIRDALRAHLQRLHTGDLERREREAYERTPDDPAEFAAWHGVAAWPEK